MRCALQLALIALVLPAQAAAAAPEARVRYLSAEQVYLDAGLLGGFAEGDTLLVLRDGKLHARLQVTFAADHSAACRLVDGELPAAGDRVRGVERSAPATRAVPPARTRRRRPAVQPPRRAGRPARRLSGSASVGWESYADDDAEGRDYRRLSARVSLRADRLLDRDLRLHLRLRQRALRRDGASAGDEHRIRLYAASLEAGAAGGPLHIALGRLGAGLQTGAGALDGLLVGRRFGETEIGAYFGAMPDWTEADLVDRGQRAGLFARFEQGALQGHLEAVSERVEGESSRDYLIASGSWRRDALSLRPHAELDWRRGWRADRGDGALGLSRASVSGSWRVRRDLDLTLRVDRRETPLDIEARSLPDSLFRAAISGGSSLRASWRPRPATTLTARLGWRDRHGAERGTLSSGLALFLRPGFARSLRAVVRWSAFDGPAARGQQPALELTRTFRGGHELELGAGLYRYSPRGLDVRDNRWLRGRLRWVLPARLWLDLGAELDSGDDIVGRRLALEIGRRF